MYTSIKFLVFVHTTEEGCSLAAETFGEFKFVNLNLWLVYVENVKMWSKGSLVKSLCMTYMQREAQASQKVVWSKIT